MPTEKPSTSKPSAKRIRLGAALRAERERAGFTSRQLGDALDWSQSKVSNLELARRRASAGDVEKWLKTTRSASEKIAELLDLVTEADIEFRTWAEVYAEAGPDGVQRKYADLNLEATHIAIYQTAVIPGLVQTAEYARRTLELIRATNPAKDAADRVERQSVLYMPEKRFEFVLTEAVLHLRINPPDAMRAQLDKLISVSTLPNVTVAVVPLDAEVRELPQTPFVLREFPDGRGLVTVETIAGEKEFDARDKVDRFLDGLANYLAVAHVGEAAEEMIRAAIKRHATP